MKVVFFGIGTSIAKRTIFAGFEDSIDEYCEIDPNINKFAQRLLSPRVQKIIPCFLRRVVYYCVLKFAFLKKTSREETIFFFTNSFYLYGEPSFQPFVSFLKTKYQNAKYAFYFTDVVEQAYPCNIDFIHNNFDLVLSFDRQDAIQYGFDFYHMVYTYNEPDENEIAPKTDVYFAGMDKGRIPCIIRLFKKFTDAGYSCIFYIQGIIKSSDEYVSEFLSSYKVSDNELRYKQSIIHLNVFCPSSMNLSYIRQCKYMVEWL